MDTPTIIRQQLYGTGATKVMSWGSHWWSKSDDLSLSFKVQARRFTGFICIRYNEEMDLYDISFYDNQTSYSYRRNKKPSSQYKPIEGVCFDEMVNLIDDRIEMTESYVA